MRIRAQRPFTKQLFPADKLWGLDPSHSALAHKDAMLGGGGGGFGQVEGCEALSPSLAESTSLQPRRGGRQGEAGRQGDGGWTVA
jgi:hypothetical protein